MRDGIPSVLMRMTCPTGRDSPFCFDRLGWADSNGDNQLSLDEYVVWIMAATGGGAPDDVEADVTVLPDLLLLVFLEELTENEGNSVNIYGLDSDNQEVSLLNVCNTTNGAIQRALTPSPAPSHVPSLLPSDFSSDGPSVIPSDIPSDVPSAVPSAVPSTTSLPSDALN